MPDPKDGYSGYKSSFGIGNSEYGTHDKEGSPFLDPSLGGIVESGLNVPLETLNRTYQFDESNILVERFGIKSASLATTTVLYTAKSATDLLANKYENKYGTKAVSSFLEKALGKASVPFLNTSLNNSFTKYIGKGSSVSAFGFSHWDLAKNLYQDVIVKHDLNSAVEDTYKEYWETQAMRGMDRLGLGKVFGGLKNGLTNVVDFSVGRMGNAGKNLANGTFNILNYGQEAKFQAAVDKLENATNQFLKNPESAANNISVTEAEKNYAKALKEYNKFKEKFGKRQAKFSKGANTTATEPVANAATDVNTGATPETAPASVSNVENANIANETPLETQVEQGGSQPKGSAAAQMEVDNAKPITSEPEVPATKSPPSGQTTSSVTATEELAPVSEGAGASELGVSNNPAGETAQIQSGPKPVESPGTIETATAEPPAKPAGGNLKVTPPTTEELSDLTVGKNGFETNSTTAPKSVAASEAPINAGATVTEPAPSSLPATITEAGTAGAETGNVTAQTENTVNSANNAGKTSNASRMKTMRGIMNKAQSVKGTSAAATTAETTQTVAATEEVVTTASNSGKLAKFFKPVIEASERIMANPTIVKILNNPVMTKVIAPAAKFFGEAAPVLATVVAGGQAIGDYSNALDEDKNKAMASGAISTGITAGVSVAAVTTLATNFWNPVGWVAGGYLLVDAGFSVFSKRSLSQRIGDGASGFDAEAYKDPAVIESRSKAWADYNAKKASETELGIDKPLTIAGKEVAEKGSRFKYSRHIEEMQESLNDTYHLHLDEDGKLGAGTARIMIAKGLDKQLLTMLGMDASKLAEVKHMAETNNQDYFAQHTHQDNFAKNSSLGAKYTQILIGKNNESFLPEQQKVIAKVNTHVTHDDKGNKHIESKVSEYVLPRMNWDITYHASESTGNNLKAPITIAPPSPDLANFDLPAPKRSEIGPAK